MPEQDPKIRELEDRLDRLVRTQIDFQREISLIRGEIVRLQARKMTAEKERSEASRYVPLERPRPPVRTPVPEAETDQTPPPEYELPRQSTYEPDPILSSATLTGDPFSRFVSSYTENARADLERFIGENLISKIGILILVLGVGIGAKYAIDNDLISPLARIVTGYAFGFGLIGLAIKLKAKYHNFSAVLVSGGFAIMYFVTYFAYSSYALLSQLTAFGLMTMFTVFTVAAALAYNRQVIAHIGLVGAYAVPFLLSTDSGNYLALFSYMTVVNVGILAISLKRYWRPIFYTSSAFTWAIFYAWFVAKYSAAEHFTLALIFLAVFFAIFFATKLAQARLFESGAKKREDLASALATAFIFYSFCFAIGDDRLESAGYWTLFTYLSIASIAILASSFRDFGRAFLYVTVPFVWLIYAGWFFDRYDASADFTLAATFASFFFAIFYFSILFHRLVDGSFTFIEHTSLVLSNAFIFYGFGYSIMDGHAGLAHYLGLFTAANAGLHLAVATLVGRIRSDAGDVVQVLTLLVLTFASISIPVQFDGNLVTMIWSAEAAVLFWSGRTRAISLFERFSYPVMLLATASMFLDWGTAYSDRVSGLPPIAPLANADLVTAAVFVAAFAFIFWTNRDERFEPAISSSFLRPFGVVVASVGGFVLYNMFRLEITNYFHLLASQAPARAAGFDDIERFSLIWQIDYTMFFLGVMAIVNLKAIRSSTLAFANAALAAFALAAFVTVGMFLVYELRLGYMSEMPDPTFTARWMYVGIRYFSYAFAAGLLLLLYRYSRDTLLAEHFPDDSLPLLFEAIAHSCVFIVASCELVNLMGQFGIGDATKLGLSILWGVYALLLIVIGIARDKKHLRIAAIVLLAAVLVKLFFYDIADLDTIPKTILFVTLGITLLVVSFLYNKYKDLIFKKGLAPEE